MSRPKIDTDIMSKKTKKSVQHKISEKRSRIQKKYNTGKWRKIELGSDFKQTIVFEVRK